MNIHASTLAFAGVIQSFLSLAKYVDDESDVLNKEKVRNASEDGKSKSQPLLKNSSLDGHLNELDKRFDVPQTWTAN
jgi:hypothetical protein